YIGVMTGSRSSIDRSPLEAADGWMTFTRTITSAEILAAHPTAAILKASVRGLNGGPAGTVWEESVYRLRDVTNREESKAAAATSLTHASSASASAAEAS